MKELVVLSGKGGTGKTSITAAFAGIAENMVLCDADVDASNLHLVLDPAETQSQDFEGGFEAIINSEKCSGCGQCVELCRFGAVKPGFEIDPIECEGCGVCVDMCPEQAVEFPRTICGQWFVSDTRFGPMVHARLGIAQENSGKLVALVRQEAARLAVKEGKELIITDGPPGIGCPVVASLNQATAVLIVAEPSVSGLHDMERLGELTRHFNIPTMVCINKFDLNPGKALSIEDLAKVSGITPVGRIAFDQSITEAMVQGKTIIEYNEESLAGREVKRLWKQVRKTISSIEAPALANKII